MSTEKSTPFYWKRFGGYDCSSKGDKRYSAFTARMPDGRTIEEHYQCDVKGYQPGGTNWRIGKGKPPLDTTKNTWAAYLDLWRTWSASNMPLLLQLRELAKSHGNCLSDRFATTGINQAHALATILNQIPSSPLSPSTAST